MTHVKNAEAFSRLVGFCTGFGAYNPGNQNLQINAMVNKLTEVRAAIEQARVAKTNFDNVVNQRRQTFNQLPRLVSGILRTLESSGAKPEKLADARSFAHLLLGRSLKNRLPIPSESTGNLVPKEVVKRGMLQLAYVSKADSFSRLAKAVSSEPLYQPHEVSFSTAGLTQTEQTLNQWNQQVAEARASWRMSLIERNSKMYSSDWSMTKTAFAAKRYIRAIYGHDSEQYALVKSLEFNQPNRK